MRLNLTKFTYIIIIIIISSCKSDYSVHIYSNNKYMLEVIMDNKLTIEDDWRYYAIKGIALMHKPSKNKLVYDSQIQIYRDDIDGTILEGSLCADYSQSNPNSPENVYLTGPIFYIQNDSVCFNISFKKYSYDKCNLWILSSKIPEFEENNEYTLLLSKK